MGEIFERTAPAVALPWTGERLTTATSGQVEIEHLHRYFFARSLCRGLDVLDVASGEGYGAALLAQVARSVTGVEIATETVAHAREAYKQPNLNFLEGDARRIPCPDASFDAVVSFETLEHLYEHDQFLAEVRRVLRPGGSLIMSSPERDVYSPAGSMPNPYHVHELTHDEFGALLQAHFAHVALYAQRPLLGSALMAEAPGGKPEPLVTFERRDSRLFEASTGLPRPIYLVAVASDSEKRASLGSLYIETSGVESIYSNATAAQSQIRSLMERLAQAEAQAGAAQKRAEHEAEARGCWALVEAQQNEARRLRDQLAACEAECAAMVMSSAAQLKRRAARYARHEAALRSSLDQYVEQCESLRTEHRAEVVRLKARIAELGGGDGESPVEETERARAILLEEQLQAVLGSSSWRMTGPMRGFAARHPRTVEGTRQFLARHPRIGSAAVGTVRGGWRLATLRAPLWPGRNTELPPPGAPQISAPRDEPRNLDLREIKPGWVPDPPLPSGGSRRALCVGHVMPYPPRAGNEYRIHRMLTWLAGQGWDLLVLICPLPHEMPDPEQIASAAAVYPNLLILDRAGTLHYSLQSGAEMLVELSSGAKPDVASLLQEDDSRDPRQARILNLLRAHFAPDSLVHVLLHTQSRFKPHLLLAEYIFMTRSFALLDPGLTKAVDTIDVFSTKARKVEQHGVSDGLALSEEEEASLLRRSDILIAIQEEEARDLSRLAPDCKVVSVGVDFAVAAVPEPASHGSATILLVASGNPMNMKGLQDFLRFAWPMIRRQTPQAEFVVAGAAGEALDSVPERVRVLGRVEDLGPLYAEARLVINPAVAGTGLKIKTVEALCHLRPVVCWPAGTDGVPREARAFCYVAVDWFTFARHVTRLLQDEGEARAIARAEHEIGRIFSPEAVYAPLGDALQNA